MDILKARIRVDQSLSDVNGKLEFGSTKTHAVRFVPFPAFLREGVEQQMEGKGPNDLLFTSPEGAPLRSHWRKRVFDPALKAAKLPTMRIHDLRHTAASLAVKSGANIVSVQNMMGHENASTTLKYYAHLFDGHLDALADKLNEGTLAARADLLRTRAREGALRVVGKEG